MYIIKNRLYAFFALAIAVSLGFHLGRNPIPDDRNMADNPPTSLAVTMQPPPTNILPSAITKEHSPVQRTEETAKARSSTKATPSSAPITAELTPEPHLNHEYDVGPIEEPEWAIESDDLSPASETDILQQMDEHLASEDRDPHWADAIENEFNQIFAEAILAGSSIVEMECRTSLCKFEVVHLNAEAAQHFASAFINNRTSSLQAQNVLAHTIKDPSGGVNNTYYWTRNKSLESLVCCNE